MIPKLSASDFLASVQPVVLVGGQSRRFGRDKLREPWGEPGQVLVQRPIEALRSVFGRRVLLVGACHPNLLPLADGTIPDRHPGIGPMGGIVSALCHWPGPIFVLAGDMPAFRPHDIQKILETARSHPEALAILAATNRVHPCAGIYMPAALAVLTQCIATQCYHMMKSISVQCISYVQFDQANLANINAPTDCSTVPTCG